MKNISRIIALLSLLCAVSCSYFLEKPDTTGTVDMNAVFSSTKNAHMAMMTCYGHCLVHGWPGGIGIGHSTLGAISGEICRGCSWHGSYVIAQQGLSVNGTDGSDAGADNFSHNWRFIRECFIVKENIDKVPDMDDATKAIYKAEATALIAYRYMGMFYRYGGVPIVRKSFEATDDLSAGRATLEEMVKYIMELCDEALAVLPEKWDAGNTGRMTKGAVLCIKARTLLFAARPLFNSDKPYLENGDLNSLICFGKYEQSRWQDAIDANEDVLLWAADNGVKLINTGGAGEGHPNPKAFEDYATATSIPANEEIILAFKNNSTSGKDGIFNFINCSRYWPTNRFDTDCSGVLTNFAENYYANDGTDMNWPHFGDSSPRPGSDYRDNVAKLEPRALADIKWGGFDSKNNPGDSYWSNVGWNRGGYAADKDKANVFPNPINTEKGCGERTKFYYKAGSRLWFEAPLFRLAEIHMNLAEAYNEIGNTTLALKHLNLVHNRAGLPAITETDKDRLRAIIQREDAIEFFQESHRYYDVKHWKHKDIANGICGGKMRMLQFNIQSTDAAVWPYNANYVETYWDAVAYEAFWKDAMYLEPFPQTEVNKGTISQNPGY